MKYATNEFWTGYPTKKPLPWKSFCGSFEELKTQLEEKWKIMILGLPEKMIILLQPLMGITIKSYMYIVVINSKDS